MRVPDRAAATAAAAAGVATNHAVLHGTPCAVP
jgi:hypothetical protein